VGIGKKRGDWGIRDKKKKDKNMDERRIGGEERWENRSGEVEGESMGESY
jgi:hypothetical protein